MSLKSLFLLSRNYFYSLQVGILMITTIFTIFYFSPVFQTIVSLGSMIGELREVRSVYTYFVFLYLFTISYYISSRILLPYKDDQKGFLFFILPLNSWEKFFVLLSFIYLLPIVITVIYIFVLYWIVYYYNSVGFDYTSELNSLYLVITQGNSMIIYILFSSYLLMASIVFKRKSSILLFIQYIIISSLFKKLSIYYVFKRFLLFNDWSMYILVLMSVLIFIFQVYLFIRKADYKLWSFSFFSFKRLPYFVLFLLYGCLIALYIE